MTQNIDWLAFALGSLVALTVVLAIGWGIAAALVSWLLRHVSGFNEASARRENGKVLLGADIEDRARPAKRSSSARKTTTFGQPAKSNGRERAS
jgi:hypothetical protein